MRAGMPRRNHGAQHGRKRDRSRTDRPLYRLRALRRRVSHRFGDPQRLPAAARTHRRYQPSTRTGAGFGADPLAALEPRADAAPHTRRSPATDRRSGTLRPHGLELPAGLLHARHRARTTAPHRRRLRLDGTQTAASGGTDVAQTFASRPLPLCRALRRDRTRTRSRQ